MDGSSSAPAIQQLGILHLAACAALLVTVVVASGVLRLGLEGRLVTSATRCAVQLLVLCAYVLEPLFSRDSPWLILGYVFLIIWLASREASSRLKYSYVGLRSHFIVSFGCGAGSVILYATVLVLASRGPFFDRPRFAVPRDAGLLSSVRAVGRRELVNRPGSGSVLGEAVRA